MSNIREVAKRAGVSTATVSRVLSRPDVVSPDTRVRVLKAVERLGYAPNSVAKNLRTLKSCKLLVTVPDISNPFFSLILKGIEDAAQKNGYAVLVGDTQHDEMREERYAQMLKQKEADGLIFLGHRLPRLAASVVQRRGAALRADRQRLRVQRRARRSERAHRQRESCGRGDAASLRARSPAHRHRHRTAAQPAQPRSARRRPRRGALPWL